MGKNKQLKIEQELAQERTELSYDRTGLSILRTNLAFQNTKMSIEQTHLSFLRTIVSLVGSAATVYKALPALGVSGAFSTILSLFLMIAAVFFIIKDRLTYPKLKAELEAMEKQRDELIAHSKADLPVISENQPEPGNEE
ncbi:MAG: DUF202 domain-containing protein [Lachnospiraceae bacterium]|nr:DUF202 domain-containing protein [Lachnospiraceae bacterium]